MKYLWIALAVAGLVAGGILEGSVEPIKPHHRRIPRQMRCELCDKVKDVALLHPVHGPLCEDCTKDVRAEERQRAQAQK